MAVDARSAGCSEYEVPPPPPAAAHVGTPPDTVNTCELEPIASFDNVFVAEAYMMSPVVHDVCAVPPCVASVAVVPAVTRPLVFTVT